MSLTQRLRKTVALIGCAALSFATSAQKPENETQVKALLVLNFINYVEWPAPVADQDIQICFVGDSRVDEALEQLRGRATSKRPISIKQAVALGELRACTVVFVAASEERRIPALLAAIESAPVLTVSDVEGFVDHGGMLGIVVTGSRLGFDANVGAARRAGLQLSSKMLQLARRVIKRDA